MNYTQEQLEAWEAALKIIEADIPPLSFNNSFKPLKLYAVKGDALYIEANQIFTINQLKLRYMTILSNAVSIAFGQVYDINLHTKEEIERMAKDTTATMLNPKNTFENFVVGASNSFAYAAALAVAEQPGDAYNPLFLYGGVGLGKTHLMNAIGNFVTQTRPSSSVLFMTSETFTNELIDTIVKKKGTSQLRNKLRGADVLLVDDIQFLSKTVATQEEFFHTFNDLHSKGKQIVISSDRPPKEIPAIEERLRSRFEWGLIIDIQKPDYETRVAILRKKADEEGIDAPQEVLEFIADRVESNIRELEGSLIRVNAQSEFMKRPISLEMAQETLSALISARDTRKVTSEGVIQMVSSHYSVSEDDLTSKRRSREIAMPRQVAMYILRELTPMSTTAIGRAFGGRDHTTVMHACDKISSAMRADTAFRRTVEELMELIKRR